MTLYDPVTLAELTCESVTEPLVAVRESPVAQVDVKVSNDASAVAAGFPELRSYVPAVRFPFSLPAPSASRSACERRPFR